MEISKLPTTVRNVQEWYELSVVRTARKIQAWYEKSMVRNVHGTKSPQTVRNVYGTNSLWYEKSGNHAFRAIFRLISNNPFIH